MRLQEVHRKEQDWGHVNDEGFTSGVPAACVVSVAPFLYRSQDWPKHVRLQEVHRKEQDWGHQKKWSHVFEPNVERENFSVVLAQNHFASHFQSFFEPSASVAEEKDQAVRKRLRSRRTNIRKVELHNSTIKALS